EYGPEDSVDALTAADSHQHFAIRIIMRTVPVFIIVADGLPESVEPRIMGILHRLRIDGVDGCLPDRLRCFKIRLTERQIHAARELLHPVGKLAGARDL